MDETLSKIEGQFQNIQGTDLKLHPLAVKSGGLVMKDERNIIPKAVKDVLAQIAKKTMKGEVTSLISIPAPAYIHYPASHLNLQANDLLFCNYLTQAAQVNDPLERIKYLIACDIAGIFPNPTLLQTRVPLNPILGETLQREMETGERFYAEQISHHPPITAFQLYGPNDEYVMSGHHSLKVDLNGTQSVGGTKKGKIILKFKDGVEYEYSSPTMSLENLMTSNRTQLYYNIAMIKDLTNGIEAEMKYNPNFDSSYKGVVGRYTVGWFSSTLGTNHKTKRPARGDDIDIKIIRRRNIDA